MNKEFYRMQELAGIQSFNEFEKLFIECVTEVHLYENYYSKGILKENLSEGIIGKTKEKVKGLVDKLKNKAEELGIPPFVAVIASSLTGLKKELGEETFNKLLNIADNFKGNPKNKKEIIQYLEDEIGNLDTSLTEAFIRDKKGNLTKLAKTILISLAMLISFKAVGGDKLVKANIGEVPGTVQNLDNDTLKDAGVSDSNTVTYDQAKQLVDKQLGDQEGGTEKIPTGGEPKIDSSKDDSGNTSTEIEFGTGDYKIPSDVKDNFVKKVADDINKNIKDASKDGKVTNVDVKIGGSTSDTKERDNPTGPLKTGLKNLRTSEGEKLEKEIEKEVKKLNPNIKINFKTVDNKDNKAGLKVSTDKIDVEKSAKPDVKKPSAGPDDLGYLRNPRVVQPDGNKLFTILGHILPLIIEDKNYNDFYTILTSALDAKAKETKKDFTITRDNLDTLRKESKDEDFIQILKWATDVDRDSKSIGEFINSLDSKIPKLGSPGGGFLPGKTGKAAQTPGSGTTQKPQPGPQSPDETNIIGEALLTEASVSDFTSLPGYNQARARRNIGILVPIYCYTWNVNDNGAIDYVSTNELYKAGWRTFEKDYPVIAAKTGKPSSSEKSDQQKPESPQSISRFDKKAKTVKIQPDITRVTQAINRDTAFKSYLKRIDNKDELANFILALFLYRDTKGDPLFPKNQTFADNSGRVRSALFTLNNTIPNNLKEADKEQVFVKFPDVKTAYTHIGRSSTLRNLLKNINNVTEFTQFIIYSILPYINPKFRTKNGLQTLKSAIALAANMSTQYKDILDKTYKKTLSNTQDIKLTEEFLRMQRLAGLITENEYKQKK